MHNLVKRVSFASLTVMMALGGFMVLVPSVHGLTTGDLVKGPNSDAVYYINGTAKHVFPDAKTYFTWYSSFAGIKTVAVTELDAYTTGAPVPYRPGTKLVTHPNTARVYAVEPAGTLRWVPSEAAALALYGPNWSKWVNDVHELTFGNYSVGTDMTATMHSKGTILQKTGDATIYYFDGTNIRPFGSSAAFDANNLDYDYVVQVSSIANYTVGSSVTGSESFGNIAGSGTGTNVPSGPAGTLTVSLSPNTPAANGILIGAAARVPMTTVRMTTGANAVVVDSVTIERGGLATDAAFSDFDLLRGDNMLPLNNTSKSLTSNHTAVFNDDFTVPANTTWDVIIAANMAASLANYAGEYPIMKVTNVTLKNNSTMSGTLPLTGNVFLTNGTITAGTARVALGSNNPSASTKEVGSKDYIVSSIKLNNNSSANNQTLRLKGISFTQNGSASPTDVENVELINTNTGAVIATIATPTEKKIHFLNLDVEILKGNTINLDLRLDIKGGSARTISYDVDQKSDVVIFDQLYNVNVLPAYYSDASYSTADTSSPVYDPADTTIGNGRLRIESLAVTPTNISENKTGVLLGKFKFVAEGEAVNITALGFKIATTTTGTLTRTEIIHDLTNVIMRDAAGVAISSPVDPVANQAANGYTATTTDTISIPVGENTYSVYGDLSGDWTAGDRVQLGIFPGAITAKGDVTGNSITASPTGQIQSSQLTIKSADLNVSVSPSPAAQTIVAGSPSLEVANLVLNASESGADVRVTSILVPIITTGNAYPDILTNLKLYVGSTEVPVSSRSSTYSNSGSTATGSGTTTLTISSGNLTIPAGQSKTVKVVGDVGTGATSGGFKVGMQSNGVTAIDSESQSFSPDFTTSQGQTMTLSGGGTLNVAIAQDPKAALAVGGTTVNIGQFTLQAKNEAMTLHEFGFSVGNPDNFINSANDYEQVEMLELWESGGSAALGTVEVSGANASITPAAATLGINQQKTYIVKAKMRDVTAPSIAESGTGFTVLLNYIDVRGTATGSSSITQSGIGTSFKTFTSFKSVPTVSTSSVTADQILSSSSLVDLFKFSVAANSAGPIGLSKFTFGIATSTNAKLDTSGFYLYESDSSGSLGNLLSAPTTDIQTVQNVTPNTSAPLIVVTRFDVGNDNSNTQTAVDTGEHLIINAGSAKYFTLRGTLSAISATANDDSISTVLAGDSTGVTSTLNVGAIDGTLDQDDFIWSDLNFDLYSTSTATYTVGWFNGYRVSGLDDTSTTPQTQTD